MLNYIGMTLGLLLLVASAVLFVIFNLSWWFVAMALIGMVVFIYFDVKEE